MIRQTTIDSHRRPFIPCTINCETRPPADWAASQYGHTHWLPESVTLHIVELANQADD